LGRRWYTELRIGLRIASEKTLLRVHIDAGSGCMSKKAPAEPAEPAERGKVNSAARAAVVAVADGK
jgi:hypothetical protein